MTTEPAAEVEEDARNVDQVKHSFVVGEDVGVAGGGEGAVLPPVPVAQVENHHGKGEDQDGLQGEQGVGDREDVFGLKALCVVLCHVYPGRSC